MKTLRFVAAEAWHELRAGCRGPLIPIVFPGLIAYLLLVLLNADYMRDMGATDVPRNSPHLVYLMVAGQIDGGSVVPHPSRAAAGCPSESRNDREGAG